ncbi:hypothetical protein [Costertonia aggregata]|uniref:Uncharacterized protein n=1 Tax=Costertonia aggregata TaxID=343403 RepID=A0A7H9ARB3_9FLAO|nr:hypothetical protein [Costertonia aggregata]QLG46018.1 hypothetical protein HYG79_11910 [Costertonia aggregata]
MKVSMDSKSIKQKETVKTIIFSVIALVYAMYQIGEGVGKALHYLSIHF